MLANVVTKRERCSAITAILQWKNAGEKWLRTRLRLRLLNGLLRIGIQPNERAGRHCKRRRLSRLSIEMCSLGSADYRSLMWTDR